MTRNQMNVKKLTRHKRLWKKKRKLSYRPSKRRKKNKKLRINQRSQFSTTRNLYTVRRSEMRSS